MIAYFVLSVHSEISLSLGLCAPNWTLYNGHCYLIDKLSKEHGEGQDFCRDSSSSGRGRLVVLANPDEKVNSKLAVGFNPHIGCV